MKVIDTVAAVVGLAALAQGHMEMKSPAPFRSRYNPNSAGDIDYSMTNPLSSSGSDFPCKGYHNMLGTAKGAPTATWTAGQTTQFTVTGGTIHAGGSCQASLSYDRGQTWKVVHTYIGNCPAAIGDTNYSFTLPNDTPAGTALFAWSWFNKIGNREMYMNCAAVNIRSRGSRKRGPSDPYSRRPNMFVANVGGAGGNRCTWEGKDVEIPNPGPDVTRNTQGTTAPGTGSCTGWQGRIASDPSEWENTPYELQADKEEAAAKAAAAGQVR